MTRPVTGGDTTGAVCAGYVGWRWVRWGGRRCRGRRRPTTWVWCATTCIAVRVRGLRLRWRTGLRSRPTPGYVDTDGAGQLLLQGHCRGRGREHQPGLERGGGDGVGRHDGAQPAGGLAGSVVGSTVNLSWTASSDNVGCHPLQRPPRQPSAGFTPSAGNRIAQPTGPSYADTGLATGSYFYKVTAEDAAGNISAASNEATATVADATPPTAPGSLTATGAGSTVNLSWGAATDNVGVSPLQPPPRHHQRLHAQRRATGSRNRPGTSYADTGLTPRHATSTSSPPKTPPATSAPPQRRQPPPSPTPRPPSTPTPSPPPAAPAKLSSPGPPPPTTSASARYNLHRSTTAGFTPSAGNRIAQPTGTSYTDTGLTAGTYYYRSPPKTPPATSARRRNQATATVTAPPVTGLVAAYGFDTGIGTTAADQSGTGNNGTLSNATWTDGRQVRQRAHLQRHQRLRHHPRRQQPRPHHRHDARGLGPADRPRQQPTARSLMKEQPGEHVVRRSTRTAPARPRCRSARSTSPATETRRARRSLPVNTWTHLAATYNGTSLALYVNGVQAGQLLIARLDRASTGALRIGGNAIWGEWFQGDIDEVRIYNRALTATEIQADMNDLDHESGRGRRRRRRVRWSAIGWVELGAAVVGRGDRQRRRRRATTSTAARRAGFTPSAGNRIAQPTGTSYTDTVAAGTYYYRVTAEDAAGNVGPASNEASATVGDTHGAVGAGDARGGRVGRAGDAVLGGGDATTSACVRYNVHRGDDAGLRAVGGEPDRAADHAGLRRHDRAGHLLLQGHRRGRGRQRRRRLERGRGDGHGGHDRAERTRRARRPGRRQHRQPELDRAPPTTSASSATTSTAARAPASRPAPATGSRSRPGTSYADTGLATGTYYYKVTAEDAAGNISAASNEPTATVADATAPTAPSALTATAAGSTVNLSWAAATDNVGVSRYNLHRGTTSGFTPSAANRIAQPTGHELRRHRRSPPARYFYKLTAEDAAGNIGPVSNTASATVPDTTAPSTPTPRRHRRRRPSQPHLDRRHRQRRRHPLQPPPLHQQPASPPPPATGSRNPPAPATPTPASPPAPTTTSSPPKTPPATSAPPQPKPPPPSPPHPSPASSPPTASTPAPAPPPPTSPAPATTARSANATWTGRRGKFGNALTFNGTNASVTIPDSTASTSPPA